MLQTRDAHVVPGPIGMPPWAAHVPGSMSRHRPGWQHASVVGGTHGSVAHVVPAAPAVPRAAVQASTVRSAHAPDGRQQATAGGHDVVAQSVPAPPGVPPAIEHWPGSVSVHVPSAWQQACVGHGEAAHVTPMPCDAPPCAAHSTVVRS